MPGQLREHESIFSAVAFAEMNEHDTALEIAGLRRGLRKKAAGFREYLQQVFAATAFTDVGCNDDALDMVFTRDLRRGNKRSLAGFLEEIGLAGARFHYVVASI